MNYPNTRDCPHGHQWGKCDTCDLLEAEAELTELREIVGEVAEGPNLDWRGGTVYYCYLCKRYVEIDGTGHSSDCLYLRSQKWRKPCSSG